MARQTTLLPFEVALVIAGEPTADPGEGLAYC